MCVLAYVFSERVSFIGPEYLCGDAIK